MWSGCCQEAGHLDQVALWKASARRVISCGTTALAPARVCLLCRCNFAGVGLGKPWETPYLQALVGFSNFCHFCHVCPFSFSIIYITGKVEV